MAARWEWRRVSPLLSFRASEASREISLHKTLHISVKLSLTFLGRTRRILRGRRGRGAPPPRHDCESPVETRVLNITDVRLQADAVLEAGRALAAGQLVIFPTETVYGLGASAVNPTAIEALSVLKIRTPDKPFTLHLADPEEAERYAGPLPMLARRLIRKTWPGPVTLVVPDRRPDRSKPAGIVEEAIYYEGTVGLRCPRSDVGQAILRAAGVPVVGSSANLGGRPAPREISEALADLRGRVPLAVDAGPAPVARASTVVRITADDRLEVLREGAVTARRLDRLARSQILVICSGNLCRSPMAEGLARRMLAKRLGFTEAELAAHGFEVSSAGTGAMAGYPPSSHAVAAMAERGIDITGHRSRPITVDGLLASDYIWVMADHHRESVVRLAPEVASRVELIDPTGADVDDPIGGSLNTYRACARQIESALEVRLAEVL
jgi:tRNA threonylcarbamoyl adenosine modification protein (Sua5/YciO/YrdC/YwlC family)